MESANPIPLNVQQHPTTPFMPGSASNAFTPTQEPESYVAPGGPKQASRLLIPTDRTRTELEDRWLPRLGRVRIEDERVLSGYTLTCVRSWCLSRTTLIQTFPTVSGKPKEQISVYVLGPLDSGREGDEEIERVTELLARETECRLHRTEHGALLVNYPSAYGQQVMFQILSGDLRQERGLIYMNTALRRLGIGGRAALGLGEPNSAIRRSFLETYRLPPSLIANNQSQRNSPQNSPSGPSRQGAFASPTDASANVYQDPLYIVLLQMVKLIQGSLILWGFLPLDFQHDGVFCDDTKAGVLEFEKEMGFAQSAAARQDPFNQHRDNLGGVLTPSIFAALSSSITSTRYKLACLDEERLPRDPFTHPKRLLNVWRIWQTAFAQNSSPIRDRQASVTRHLNVIGLHNLHSSFFASRERSPIDRLKIHRLVQSGVQHATNTLKGGVEDIPLKERELVAPLDNRDGFRSLVVRSEVFGDIAPPDVITDDLDKFVKGLKMTRAKELDLVGAARVAAVFDGDVGELKPTKGGRLMGFLSGRLRNFSDGNESDSEGVIGGTVGKVGTLLRGGFDEGKRVVKRGFVIEGGSESEAGPSRRSTLLRKPPALPVLNEPEAQRGGFFSDLLGREASPAPSVARSRTGRPSVPFLSIPGTADRPSLDTRVSGVSAASDGPSASLAPSRMDFNDINPGRSSSRPRTPHPLPPGTLPIVHDTLGHRIIRCRDDSADVEQDDRGNFWVTVNPKGQGRGWWTDNGQVWNDGLVRRRSMATCKLGLEFPDAEVADPRELALDLELRDLVLKLDKTVLPLAEQARDLEILVKSLEEASKKAVDENVRRGTRISEIRKEADYLRNMVAELEAEPELPANFTDASKSVDEMLRGARTDPVSAWWNMRQVSDMYKAMQAEQARIRASIAAGSAERGEGGQPASAVSASEGSGRQSRGSRLWTSASVQT